MQPFHLAIPVHDLAAARRFYGGLLGCEEGRSRPAWVDFDFYGHQLVAHLAPEEVPAPRAPRAAIATAKATGTPVPTQDVDGHAVPVRHFGIVLEWSRWHALADHLRAQGEEFLIDPHVRFAGQVGEQATLFIVDPSGNALEFKAFKQPDQLFARDVGEASAPPA